MKRLFFIFWAVFIMQACGLQSQDDKPQSASGVTKATVRVQTDLSGKTIEQNNIINRLLEDNKPGSIKHLYIISAYSGQVLINNTLLAE